MSGRRLGRRHGGCAASMAGGVDACVQPPVRPRSYCRMRSRQGRGRRTSQDGGGNGASSALLIQSRRSIKHIPCWYEFGPETEACPCAKRPYLGVAGRSGSVDHRAHAERAAPGDGRDPRAPRRWHRGDPAALPLRRLGTEAPSATTSTCGTGSRRPASDPPQQGPARASSNRSPLPPIHGGRDRSTRTGAGPPACRTPPSSNSRRRMWLSSYQDSVARLIALGLTSGPRAMTDARTAALTRTAVTLAAIDRGRVAGQARGRLDVAGAGDGRERRTRRRTRPTAGSRPTGAARAPPRSRRGRRRGRCAAGSRGHRSRAAGGRGGGARRGGAGLRWLRDASERRSSGGAACTQADLPEHRVAGGDAVAGTMKNSLSIPGGLRRPQPVG